MAIYNYQNILGVDRDSYELWAPQIDNIERRAISQLKLLAPDFDYTKPNQVVFDYCSDLIALTLFGDSMSVGLQEFRKTSMQEIEARLKFSNSWRQEVKNDSIE